MKFSLSLRILGLDHYQFLCLRQATASVASWNSPFNLIHLFTRALLNSHWLVTLEWKPFLQLILIISKPSNLRPHIWIKPYSFLLSMLARSTYIIYISYNKLLQIWDYTKSYNFVSFTVSLLVNIFSFDYIITHVTCLVVWAFCYWPLIHLFT